MTTLNARLVSVSLKAITSLGTMPQHLITGRLEIAQLTSSMLKAHFPIKRYDMPSPTPSVKALLPIPAGSLTSPHCYTITRKGLFKNVISN